MAGSNRPTVMIKLLFYRVYVWITGLQIPFRLLGRFPSITCISNYGTNNQLGAACKANRESKNPMLERALECT